MTALWLGLLLGPALAQAKKAPAEEAPNPLSFPASGFYAVARAYTPSQEVFEAAWRGLAPFALDMKRLRGSSGFGPFLSESHPQPVSFAYQSGESHHRILGFAYDNQHYLVIVRFKEPAKDDLAIFLSFPAEIPEAQSKSVAQVLEYLPYSLNTAKPRKDYPLTPDGKIDPKVFMRDFFSVLVSVY